MDCNSMIYDAVYKLNASHITENIANQIIAAVIESITNYIHLLKPSNNILIAFDGVAPVAKLEQQRSRRFKSQYTNRIHKSILNTEEPEPWNTAAITPGTYFMQVLDEKVKRAFSDPSVYQVSRIVFTGSKEVGEGEHKIFEYIRNHPDQHTREQNTIIYGLDADLIMLSIHHLPISEHIFLFRETPEFIKSIQIELEPNASYVLDIPKFADIIVEDMNLHREDISDEQKRNTIYDYIFMCFMLGNDFLPHFPAINIRTGGIDKLLNTYKEVIGGKNKNLTNGTRILWNHLRTFLQALAAQEHAFLKQEHKLRDKREKYKNPIITPQDKVENFKNIPVFERSIEKYIHPFRDDWQIRYYQSLFDMEVVKEDAVQRICTNYLEGLEWTMKYYTSGCPDWRWCYAYHYPPLLSDLVEHVPLSADVSFIPTNQSNPVSNLVQMCYVLPRNSLELLPTALHQRLLREKLSWYPADCSFHWAYCKYFWESHPDLPHIDIHELETFVSEADG